MYNDDWEMIMEVECAVVEMNIMDADDEEKEPNDWDDMEDGEWDALMKYSPAYEGV